MKKPFPKIHHLASIRALVNDENLVVMTLNGLGKYYN
jgi:hypothetical protein